MGSLVDNIRFALRDVRRQSMFAAAVALTLAIGIGATSAGFSLVNAVFLTRLPVVDQDRLVLLWGTGNGFQRWGMPLLDTQRFLLERRQTFAAVSAAAGGASPFAARDGDRTLHLTATFVPASFFAVVGLKPAVGRLFRAEDDVPSARGVVVVSDALWRRGFGADPRAIGRTLFFNGTTYQIVGVAPPEFSYPGNTEAWAPLQPQVARWGIPLEKVWSGFIARLQPGVSVRSAKAALEYALRADSTTGKYVPQNADLQPAVPTTGVVDRLIDVVLGREVRPAVIVLFAAAALLLVIACTNVAGLLLARGISRQQDLAVRRALGASRPQLMAYLLTESAILGIGGGVLGVVLAAGLVRGIKAFAPHDLPMIDAAHLDLRVVAFTAVLTVGCVVAFGIIPALRGSASPGKLALQGSNRSVTIGRGSGVMRRALVAAQVALALVVLLGAGVLARTLLTLDNMPLGFDMGHLVFFKLDPVVPFDHKAGYLGFPTRFTALRDRIAEEFPRIPGLGPVTSTYLLPFTLSEASFAYAVDGQALHPKDAKHLMDYQAALDEYFDIFKIPLLAGRVFTPQDDRRAPIVVVVNQAMARQAWPGQDPLGHRIKVFTDSVDRWWTVVGVVADDHFGEVVGPALPRTYFPARQEEWDDLWLAVKTPGDPRAAEGMVAEAIKSMDPTFAVRLMTTGPEILAMRLARPRALAWVFGGLASTALLLAAIGLFGVLSAYVRDRRREIAVRGALGATPSQLRALILGQTVTVAAAGVICGVPLALLGSRGLRSIVSGVEPTDALTVLAVAAVLLAVVAIATYLPMVRASRVDVRTALATE